MTRLADLLTGLTSPWGYVLVGVMATLEASAFVGLFIPGETAMLVGGFLAYQGKASLWIMMAVAAVGAVVGDSVGYEIGRRFGPSLRSTRLGRRVGEQRWQRAEEYLARRGGRAVFFGRFVGVLRAVVPTVAGLGRMPYRTFLVWNAAGGLIWAPGFVLIGYLAGSSYHRVERVAGKATLLLIVLALFVGLIVALGQLAARHQHRVVTAAQRLLDRPGVLRIRARYRAQLAFLDRRLRPGTTFGLSLTVGLTAAAGFAWIFGVAITDVIARNELAAVDEPVRRFFVARHEPFLTTAMQTVAPLGRIAALAGATLLFAAWERFSHHGSRLALLLTACLLGSAGAAAMVSVLVNRVGPAGSSASFPSLTVTVATAWLLAAVILIDGLGGSWQRRVAVAAVASVIAVVIGFAELYLDRAWFADAVGGASLGALWSTIVLVSAKARGLLPAARSSHLKTTTP